MVVGRVWYRKERRSRRAGAFVEQLEGRCLLAGDGLKGQYFNQLTPTGTPALTRVDYGVNFDWQLGSPAPAISTDSFSVLWTGQIEAEFSETYTFYTTADDGVRLWVNGQPLIDEWFDQGSTEYSGNIALLAGQRYDIRMEYYDGEELASATLGWSSASQSKELIPAAQLFSEKVGSVVRFTLYNAETDSPITTLEPGMTLNYSQLPTKKLSIRAEVDEPVGSVAFYYDNLAPRIENSLPYMNAGNNENDIYAWTPSVGTHALTAIPFFGDEATGPHGRWLWQQFTVVNPETIPPRPTGLTLRTASSADITMSWNDISGSSSQYVVERSMDGVNYTVSGMTYNGLFTDSSLTPRTRYWYRVKAVNTAGPSAYTGVLRARTAEVVPTIPGFPGEANTGPINRPILVPVGSFDVTQNGAIIENVYVTGRIDIKAHNVTIRNFVIEASIETGIKVHSGFLGTVIQDGEIFGINSTNAVVGSNYTARRLHIHHMGADAFRVYRNVVIESCYVHDLGLLPDSHGDGVQMYPTDGGNIVIHNNHFDARGANSALFQVNNNWQIGGNYFNGGNYTVQAGGEVGIKFVNNTFGRAAKFGPIRVTGDADLLVWEGNVWADTGLELLL